MRLPNGFGSVYKLAGNRRNPYIARKTIGWDENGKQLYFTVGYFSTRVEGLAALAEHYARDYDPALRRMTFAELYRRWAREKYRDISESNIRGYKAAFKHAAPLHGVRFSDLRTAQLQRVLDGCPRGYQTRKKIQILFSQLYRYAMEHDICTKNYAAFLRLGRNPGSREKIPFNKEEIAALAARPEGESVLILLYSGLRVSELLELRTENIDLKARTMRGGKKTAAGKDRIIPIHKRILPIVRRLCARGVGPLLRGNEGEALTYHAYRSRIWDPLMTDLGLEHTPHDTRHTFISMASDAGADPIAVKRIVGHACGDITERVYTHKSLAQLRRAMDLIP